MRLSRNPVDQQTAEVTQVLADPEFEAGLADLAGRLGSSPAAVRAEAVRYLTEMSATHEERSTSAWRQFGRWILRAYDVYVDEDKMARLKQLDRRHTLIFLFSHRSYLDAWVLPEAMASRHIGPAFGFGGANLNFFPFGTLASRTGMVFIRRATTDIPVYRLALRSYIAQLVRNRSDLGWSIEGGRTRTGKLRPPAYGILRYVVDAVESVDGPEVLVVPISMVYDQLHEVAKMTSEARGGRKNPENFRWLVGLARDQRQRLGRAFIDVGEPIPLRERLASFRREDAEAHAVERLALEVMHGINQATPVTATAVVSLSLLGQDRALDLEEVLATVRPLAKYIAARNWPVAGLDSLNDRSTVRRTLQQMVSSGVLTCYDEGTAPVYAITEHQHLVAAFYRNTAIHMLVHRAIAELALLGAADDPGRSVLDEALRLRELLKFEFFFPGREKFEKELSAELALIGTQDLEKVDLLLAPLVLRPFLDAYHVVADRLAALEGDDFEEAAFLADCLRVGKQWDLQRRVASTESVSTELFRTALRLAQHRELLEAPEGQSPAELHDRRLRFDVEIEGDCDRVNRIADLALRGRLDP
jgi:glycerol-3-phosphate O-acyltransferase